MQSPFKRQMVVQLGFALLSSWALACADDPDTEAPAPPTVAPVVTPTSLDAQDLTGSAESSALITIKGGAAIVTATVDPYTTHWRATVTLAPAATNTLLVTATDGAGNESLPTTVTVEQEAPRPESLVVTLDRATVSTDDATLVARATVGNAEAGVPLEGLDVQFSVGEFGGVADQIVQTDSHGHAVATFTGLTVPGDAVLTASAVADDTIVAVAPFTVVPGHPKTFEVTLSTDGGAGGGATAATVTAGTDVGIEVTITDASGNPVDAPVALTTTAPGAINDSVLTGVTTAGAYTVTASLLGTLDTATATLTVTPGPAASVSIALDHDHIVAGESVGVSATVADQYGNLVDTPAFDFAVDTAPCAPQSESVCVAPSATVSGPAAAFSVRRAGDFAITAAPAGSTTLLATGTLHVAPAAPATLAFDLVDSGTTTSLGEPAAMTAGRELDVIPTIEDAYGNAVAESIDIATDMPGVLIGGQHISRVLVAGTYQLLVSVSGTALGTARSLTVTPAEASHIALAVGPSPVVAGNPVAVSAVVTDVFGNATGDAATIAMTPAADALDALAPACAGKQDAATSPFIPCVSSARAITKLGSGYTITAGFPGLEVASAAITVLAESSPASLSFDLVDSASGTSLGDPASVAVGHDVEVVTTLLDSFGNDVDKGVDVATDLPGALVGGHHIGHVSTAGAFHVIATAVGTSLGVSRDLTVTPGPDATIALTVSPDVVVAGKPVTVIAVVLDAYGNKTGHAAALAISPGAAALDGLSPTCAGTQDPAASPFIPCVSSERAVAELGGPIRIIASLAGVPDAATDLTVLPAPAQTIAKFEPTASGAAADGRINAGEDVLYVYRVVDGYGNPVDVPLAVTVTDPDAKVLDDGVSGQGLIAGLVRSSPVAYQVNARISGTGVTRSFAVAVDPALGDRFVTLVPSTSSIAMGGDVILTATVRDLYSNIIPGAAFAFSLDSSPCAPLPEAECYSPNGVQSGAGATFTISRVGVFALTASYTDANGTFKDTRYVSVQPVIDVTPPTITLKNVRKNGQLCATPQACNWQSGETVTFEVSVVDDHGISQVSYSAFFGTAGTSGTLRSRIILVSSGTLSASPSFAFTIPNSTSIENVDLVGQASDQVGNISNSAAWTIRVRAMDPAIADGKNRTIDLVGVVTGGSDVDDAVYDASGRLLAIDRTGQRLVQIVGPTSYFTLANLNTAPSYVAADDYGNSYVSGTLQGSSVVKITAAGTVSTYIDVANDINTAAGNSGACEPGNGGEAMGLAILPVLRASVRISPAPPIYGPHVKIANASGSPSQTYTFAGGVDINVTRDTLRAAMQTAPFAGLSALRGPCSTATTVRYCDLELLADFSLVPGATDIVNNTGNVNVIVDSPVDMQPTLLFGSRSRYVHAIDAVDAGAAPSCYRVRYDFGGGETRAVAANYEGSPQSLVIYGADRTGGTIHRVVASTGASTTIATLQTPHDLVVAPSGCVIATEEATNRVVMIDPNSASCSPLPCDTQVLANGFSAVRGLAIDSVDVVAAWTPWQPTEVQLTARLPGSAGNVLSLSSSSGAFSPLGFSGGTDGASGAKAVGTILVGAGVSDGDAITVGTHTYEIAFDATPAISAGHVPVHVATAAPSEVASALSLAIRKTEARLLVTDRTADAVIEIRPTLDDTSDCF